MLQTTDNDGGVSLVSICLIDNELFCRLGAIQFSDNLIFGILAEKLFCREPVCFFLFLFKCFPVLSIFQKNILFPMQQYMSYFVKKREPEHVIPLLFVSHLDTGYIVNPSRATIDWSMRNVCRIEDFYTGFRT